MTKYDPNKHHRRSIRLKGYDYTQPGAYVVTICTNQRKAILAEIVDGEMVLNECGGIVGATGIGTRRRRAPTKEGFGKPIAGSIPTIVRAYKSITTKRINQTLNSPGVPAWQRNFYERIVRDDRELNAIRRYIQDNLLKWEIDRNNSIHFQTGV